MYKYRPTRPAPCSLPVCVCVQSYPDSLQSLLMSYLVIVLQYLPDRSRRPHKFQ